jgi:RNA polymerase sigma factor (sigma-70 family)
MSEDTKHLEQELLAIRCQLGEPAAFDELVERWHKPLWRYIRRISDRDDVADELLQETWLRVLRGIVQLRNPRDLTAWMFGIARRVLMDRLRDKYKQPVSMEESFEAASFSSEEVNDGEDIEELLHEVNQLSWPQRELLTLYYLDGLSVDEISRVLNVATGTVKSRLYNARKTLKQRILKEEC